MRDGSGMAGQVALVVGASGGIGTALVSALLDAGAREVIAASRRPAVSTDSRVIPVRMDLTSAASVLEAAQVYGALVDWVICVGGVNSNHRLDHYDERAAREEMETNYFGLINVYRAFAPSMKERRCGAFVNVLSVLALVNHPMMATYCASKAAALSLTQAMRAELATFGVRVHAVMPPAVDTRMSSHIPQPKLTPAAFAQQMVDSLLSGTEDIYPGAAAALRDSIRSDPKAVEQTFASRLAVR